MTTRRLPFALPALLLGAGLLVTPPASAAAPAPDHTPPVVTVPAALTAEATGPSGAIVTYVDATALDDVDGPLPTTCLDQANAPRASGDSFPLGTTTITCTATDAADNTGQESFTVTVEDTTGPVVTVPADPSAEATGPLGAVVSYADASATDLVDGPVPVTCVDEVPQGRASGDTFPVGATTVTCTATDATDNSGQASFTVTVHDTTDPVVTVPSNKTVEATGPSGRAVTFTTPTATDLVNGSLPTTCRDQANQVRSSGDTYPLGTTILTCKATDAANNTGQASFTITVHDTTAPSVSVPSNRTVEATGPSGRTVTFTAPSATDLVDGTLPTSCRDQDDQVRASGDTYPLGTTTITCTATDTANNTGQASFTITVRDTTDPAVTVPSNKTVEATGPSGAVVTFTTPSATDLVDGTVATTCRDQANQVRNSGDTYPLGTMILTCKATDAANNTGQASFSITVHDTTGPAITVPANITREATGPNGRQTTWVAPSATDLVSGSRTVTCSSQPTAGLASGDVFPLGVTTIDCAASDSAGNQSHSSFTITVRDTTKPLISGTPGNIQVEATSASGAPATFTLPTATDLVDGNLAVNCDHASGSTFPLYATPIATTVTCSVTDAAHNTATSQFTVTVVDYTSPELVTPENPTYPAESPLGASVTLDVYAMDLVDGRIDADCTPLLAIYPIGTTTITCSVIDTWGNEAITIFDLTVEGVVDPQLTASIASAKPKLHGWYRTPVTVSFTCTPGSSVDLDPCPEPVVVTESIKNKVIDRSIDAADGGHAHVAVTVSVDLVKPTVRITKLSSKSPRCVASDAMSGVDSCRLTHHKVGKKIVWTATAVDLAGNRQVVKATTRA
ncbi:MAG: HYR domain-containing protein [Nocardioidaceae bacterium]